MVHSRLNEVPKIQSSHAILLVSGGYALQLRDDKPTISAPGAWSLFGGMIRQGETPLQTIEREIAEELCLEAGKFHPFGFQDYYSDFEKEVIRTWFYVADVTQLWSGHKLTEGQDAAVFAFEELSALTMPPVMRQVVTQFHQAQGAWPPQVVREEPPDKMDKGSSKGKGANR